jgi:hypothetical protein
MVTVIASANKSRVNSYRRSIADTIIKLDSLKNSKPIKGKKSAQTLKTNSTIVKKDTIQRDTAKKDTGQNGGVQSEVKVVSSDSTDFDQEKDILYVYGHGRVTYSDFELDADYIRVNKKTHLIFASGSIDPKTKRYIGRPISKQKDDKPVLSDSLLVNYETKKAYVWNPSTQQGDDYITHGQVKKLNETEVAYRNIIFTTCDKPDPDFGVVITRGIGEKKQIISGPAYLEIEGVPIPVAIPFGFFPKQDTRTSGVILPTFGEDNILGFYLRNFGYYLGLSDYADITTTGTYYTNNSYEVNSIFEYMNRYKFTGTLSLSYGSHNYQLPGDPPAKDFSIVWSHTQNPNASPGTTFTASVNAGTSSFYQNNPASINYNLQQLTQNNLSSSIAYGHVWAGTPFNLNVSLRHSQDLTNKTVTLELPTFSFNMSTINPFDSKDRVNDPTWYQKITVGYSLTGTNTLNAIPESELFKGAVIKKMQNGLEHQIPIALSLNFLKYFQFNTGINYTEKWYFQTIRQHFARADSLVTDTVPGFQRVGQYNLNAGFSTKLYGTLNFKNGKIRAIRHVMTPSIGFSYSPDYSQLNSYNKSIVSNATVPYPVVSQRYSIFQQSVYGGPGGGKQAGISLSLDNSVEAKIRPKSTDTSTEDKKIQLLQDLSFSTFYNFAADSFRLSPISFSGHTAILHDKVNISFSGSLNPYVVRKLDSISGGQVVPYIQTVNRYSFQDGKFPMLTNFSLSASASLNPAAFHPTPRGLPPVNTLQTATPQQTQQLALINPDPSAYIDFNIPWNLSLNYTFSYNNDVISTSNTNTMLISGDISLTKNWKIQYNTSYDLKVGKLSSATSFVIYRNLHCWNLSMQWVPFGYYKSYNITLRVNSAVLQDLKLTKRSDYTSNPNFVQ